MKDYISATGIFGLTVASTVLLLYVLPFAFPQTAFRAGNVRATGDPLHAPRPDQKTPQTIEDEILAWSNVVGQHPDYRDGYVQLAYFYYLKKDPVQARSSIDKALDIDPNYATGITLRDLILQM